MIDRKTLESFVDMKEQEEIIKNVIVSSLDSPLSLLSFVHHYISWNGYFGSGVATLSGKIGRSRNIFRDRDDFIATSDRSVLIASYVFDAARDEFNDKSTSWRDTHRCLAQAFLKGCHNFFKSEIEVPNQIYNEPFWLRGLNARVAQGYGAYSPDTPLHIFHAMGYHLGSEFLADKEFSIIDQKLCSSYPELISYLDKNNFQIGESQHNGYTWLHTHSGHGHAVEADHFDAAIAGVQFAYKYIDPIIEEEMDYHLRQGFLLFARDHQDFFSCINNRG